MDYLLICTVALVASGLTFFTGFGLGTLLLPAFAVFFPIEVAVSLTAIVHLLNNVFKFTLVGRKANFAVALRFGAPAVVAAFAGAWLLASLTRFSAMFRYRIGEREFDVTPIELAIAILMFGFAALEVSPRFKKVSLPPRYLPIGGLVTGFFGGLSGHQGALRSAFLLRAGLEKEAFIATGVVTAVLVDLSRLTVYFERFAADSLRDNAPLLAASASAAFAGAMIGNKLLKKISLRAIEIAVAILLTLVALGIGTGLV